MFLIVLNKKIYSFDPLAKCFCAILSFVILNCTLISIIVINVCTVKQLNKLLNERLKL